MTKLVHKRLDNLFAICGKMVDVKKHELTDNDSEITCYKCLKLVYFKEKGNENNIKG